MARLTIQLNEAQQIEALSKLDYDKLLTLLDRVDYNYGNYDVTAEIVSFFIDKLMEANDSYLKSLLEKDNISPHLKHAVMLKDVDDEKLSKFLQKEL